MAIPYREIHSYDRMDQLPTKQRIRLSPNTYLLPQSFYTILGKMMLARMLDKEFARVFARMSSHVPASTMIFKFPYLRHPSPSLSCPIHLQT